MQSVGKALSFEMRLFHNYNVTQVEGRLAAEGSGVANQEQSEMQDKSNIEAAADTHVPGAKKQHEADKLASTLQYIAEQAGITHEFQKDIQAQKQDKSEL